MFFIGEKMNVSIIPQNTKKLTLTTSENPLDLIEEKSIDQHKENSFGLSSVAIATLGVLAVGAYLLFSKK